MAGSSARYTLSLHDALPIWSHRKADRAEPLLPDDAVQVFEVQERREGLPRDHDGAGAVRAVAAGRHRLRDAAAQDRKSTRLNSSHPSISYAVLCLKTKISTT